MKLFKMRLSAFLVALALAIGIGTTATVVVPAVAPASAPAIIAPQPAHADAYRVKARGYRNINIYNHAGCWGAHARVYPGHWAPTTHLWKTFWLPPNTFAEIHRRTLLPPYQTYTLWNGNDWPTCHNIGRPFGLQSDFSKRGWTITLYRIRWASASLALSAPEKEPVLNQTMVALAA